MPERTNDKQHPIVKISNLEDNFAVAWYAAGAKSLRPLACMADTLLVSPAMDVAQVNTWRQMLANYRENLLLIEEHMSEFVEFTDIPLVLVRNKRQTEQEIAELERKLVAYSPGGI